MEILFNQGGAGGKSASDSNIKEGSTATFVQDVIEESLKTPVIVSFWITGHAPCKTLGTQLEALVKAAKGAVKLVTLDVDKNQDLAAQMRLQSVPAVYAFKDGRPVDGFVGMVSETQLKEFIGRLTGDADAGAGVEEALAEAQQFVEQGDLETALAIYQEVLAQDPASIPALCGYLRGLIQLGQVEDAKKMLASLPADVAKKPEIIAVKTAIELADQAEKLGSTAELRRAILQNPDDHQSRLDLALAYYSAGEREAAVDELLEIIRRDRAWNEDAARKQLVKLFEAFGPTDPLTVASRRRLSSLLFS